MLVIRKAQMEALESALLIPKYEAEMIDDLRTSQSEMVSDKSDAELRSFVRLGVRRAKSYGADETYAYGIFTDLMVMFGEDFPAQPEHAWAVKILRRRALRNGNDRIEAVMDSAIALLESQDAREDGLPDDGEAKR